MKLFPRCEIASMFITDGSEYFLSIGVSEQTNHFSEATTGCSCQQSTSDLRNCEMFAFLDMLAMVVSESSFDAYVCLTRPALPGHRDERSRRCIRLHEQQSDRTETFDLQNDATVRRIVTTFVWPQTQFHENLQTCKILLCKTVLQTSFAWSWVASQQLNAILFLPFVKGNQKLRNAAPTVSIAHQTDFPSITPDVFRTISFNILDDWQCKKLLFANFVAKKKHGVGWPPKTMRNSSSQTFADSIFDELSGDIQRVIEEDKKLCNKVEQVKKKKKKKKAPRSHKSRRKGSDERTN